MSNNGSINDALDKAQRGLLDFFFPGAIRYAPAPSANVPRRCITRAASATPFWLSNSSGASRT